MYYHYETSQMADFGGPTKENHYFGRHEKAIYLDINDCCRVINTNRHFARTIISKTPICENLMYFFAYHYMLNNFSIGPVLSNNREAENFKITNIFLFMLGFDAYATNKKCWVWPHYE